jgi:hypothetical protein
MGKVRGKDLKIGNRIIVHSPVGVHINGEDRKINKIGTVIAINKSCISVYFDEPITGHDCALPEKCKPGHGWNIAPYDEVTILDQDWDE